MKSKKKVPKQTTWFDSFIENIRSLNTSKFFTGMIMLTLNISSKYVTLGLSSSQEEYLKYSLGRQILIFALLWMGTRDIIVALILTCVFIIFADYLFNDNSMFCVIPAKYSERVQDIEQYISNKEINDAITLLKRARSQKTKGNIKSVDKDLFVNKGLYKENFI
jgi:hypothetical protein